MLMFLKITLNFEVYLSIIINLNIISNGCLNYWIRILKFFYVDKLLQLTRSKDEILFTLEQSRAHWEKQIV